MMAMIMAAGMLLAGCATIKRAREAQDPKKQPPGERTVTAAEAGLGQDSVLTLPRALEIADKYQPTIVQARQNLRVAEGQAKDALAAYFPDITGSAKYTWSETENQVSSTSSSLPKAFSSSIPATTHNENYNLGISLNQLLFDFGKTNAAVRQANYNVVSARERLQLARDQVAYQIKIAYYSLLKAQALVKVATEQMDQFQLQLDQIQILLDVGRTTGYDRTKAQVNLSNSRAQLLNAQNSVITSRATLNQTMGLIEDPGYQIELPVFNDYTAELSDLMKTASEHNPELLALTAEDKMASSAVDASIAGLFPTLSASAGLSWSGSKFPLPWTWSIGPALAGTIFDGLRNINKIDEMTAQLKSAHSRKAAKEQQIYLNLSQALTQLQNAQQQLKVREETVKEAELNVSQVKDRYNVGRASMLEVTDAQLTLTTARANLIQARYDQQSAIASIRQTTGEDTR
jgi:outer membrane protein